jgi:hypothetical protein
MQLTTEDRAHLHAWAGWLESGEYVQNRHSMSLTAPDSEGRVSTGYCCLAVERLLSGCRVDDCEWVAGEVFGAEDDIRLPSGDPLNFLPERLPWPAGSGSVLTFVSLNDEAECTFAQLADVVRYLADNAQEG